MTAEQFLNLDEMEQQEAIWEGNKIGMYDDEKFLYECYQIDGFYVETRRIKKINLVLAGLRAFENTDLLEPYLK